MMQTQIPSGLQALMQASQVLSSQASQTAPGPQGPQPTVAERVNQQIKQVSQPQGIAGVEQMPPNMQDIGKQAGIAGQIMAQRQAQQQQQAQNPEAVAQIAAQMLKGQGVAGLPVNMGFKEGGIIGFDGETGSEVVNPNEALKHYKKVNEFLADPAFLKRYASDKGISVEEFVKGLQADRSELDENLRKFGITGSGASSEGSEGESSAQQAIPPSMAGSPISDTQRAAAVIEGKKPENVVEADVDQKLIKDALAKVRAREATNAAPSAGIETLVRKRPAPAPVARPAPAPAPAASAPAPAAASTTFKGIEQIIEEDRVKNTAILAPIARELKQAQDLLAAATKSQDPNSAQFYAKKVAELKNRLDSESRKLNISPESIPTAAPVVAPAAAPAAPPAAALPAAAPVTVAQKPAAPTVTQQPAQPAQPAKPSASSMAERIKERSTGILSGITEPTVQSVVQGAELIAPSTAEAAIKELKEAEGRRAKLKEGQEDLTKQGINALEADLAARKQLLKSREERDQFNRFAAFFRDMATGGFSYQAVQEGIFARQEADRLADLAHNKAIIELKKAQQADKLGDEDRKIASLKEYNELRNKEKGYRTQAAEITQRLATSGYSAKTQAATTAAQLISQEDIDKRRLEMEGRRLGVMAQERKDAGLNNRITAAQGQMANAWKIYEKVKEDNKLGLMVSDEDAAKDPTAKRLREQAVKATNEAYKKIVTPAIDTHDRLVAELGGFGNKPTPKSDQNKTDPLGLR
jgi:hypothetical protein